MARPCFACAHGCECPQHPRASAPEGAPPPLGVVEIAMFQRHVAEHLGDPENCRFCADRLRNHNAAVLAVAPPVVSESAEPSQQMLVADRADLWTAASALREFGAKNTAERVLDIGNRLGAMWDVLESLRAESARLRDDRDSHQRVAIAATMVANETLADNDSLTQRINDVEEEVTMTMSDSASLMRQNACLTEALQFIRDALDNDDYTEATLKADEFCSPTPDATPENAP